MYVQMSITQDIDIENCPDLSTYNSSSDFPIESTKSQVYIDQEKMCVFVPVNGIPVPFHISTIRNVTKTEGEESGSLRFNFYTPTTTVQRGIDIKLLKAWKMNPLAL